MTGCPMIKYQRSTGIAICNSCLFAMAACFVTGCAPAPAVRIGSKQQPEAVILGEMATLLARNAGARPHHAAWLGGTRVLWNAVLAGEIDGYAEYTGTITAEILSSKSKEALRDLEQIRGALAEHQIRMSQPLGFNDTYAIGMRKEAASRLHIGKISDLRNHPQLKFGFSSEFMDRADGWPGLRSRYRLPQQDVHGLNHDLAYQGLVSGAIDATDLYSTDPKIRRFDLSVLEDDLNYFPSYQAVLLYRVDLEERAPAIVSALLRLEGKISENAMIEMNARAEEDKVPESQVAADYLANNLGVQVQAKVESKLGLLLRLTREHIFLVLVS